MSRTDRASAPRGLAIVPADQHGSAAQLPSPAQHHSVQLRSSAQPDGPARHLSPIGPSGAARPPRAIRPPHDVRAPSAARRARGPLGRALAAAGLVLALLASGAAATSPSLALGGGPATMEILVDGRPIPEYLARSSWYVEALAGREYAIRLTNRTDRRIAIALTVDGINSIDAKTTAAADATKWILGPYESITIDGWQTSARTARKFFFTSEARSYGSWLGKTRNLGVIAAAVFREKPPVPRPLCGGSWWRDGQPCPQGRFEENERQGAGGKQKMAREHDAPDAGRSDQGEPPASEPSPPPDSAPEARSRSQAGSEGGSGAAELRKDASRTAPSDDLAATGIGRELDHRVVRVTFDAEERPATILEVRYEYRDALVKLGVLPRCDVPDDRLARRERAHGFTDGDFAPDPYRRDRR